MLIFLPVQDIDSKVQTEPLWCKQVTVQQDEFEQSIQNCKRISECFQMNYADSSSFFYGGGGGDIHLVL